MHSISGVHVLGAGQKEELKLGHPAGEQPPRTPPPPAVQPLHANLQLKWLQFGRFIHSKYKSRSSRIFREPPTGSSEKPTPALKLTVEAQSPGLWGNYQLTSQ